MQTQLRRLIFSLPFLLFLSAVPVASANSLVDLATSTLGVTQPQAEGGMGALLGSAKSSMGDSQYANLLGMVPSLGGLAGAMPGGTAPGKGLGGLAAGVGSMLGGSTGSSLGSLGQVTQAFESLGLSPQMVGQFADLLLGYVQEQGGAQAFDLLKGALPF